MCIKHILLLHKSIAELFISSPWQQASNHKTCKAVQVQVNKQCNASLLIPHTYSSSQHNCNHASSSRPDSQLGSIAEQWTLDLASLRLSIYSSCNTSVQERSGSYGILLWEGQHSPNALLMQLETSGSTLASRNITGTITTQQTGP